MKQSDNLTIPEIAKLLNKTTNTCYRYVREKKLNVITVLKHGKNIVTVEKAELERFCKENDIKCYNNVTIDVNSSSSPDMTGVIEQTINKTLNQMARPMEEQALFVAGKLTSENQFLKQRLETVLNENQELQEKIKALPDKEHFEKIQLENQDLNNKLLYIQQEKEKEINNKLSQIEILEKEKEDILSRAEIIQKEKEEQERKTEGLNQVLLDNANNIKELAKEKENFSSVLKEHESTIKEKERSLKDLDELHRQELEQVKKQAEEEKKAVIDECKKQLQEYINKPWYKRLW